MATGSVRPAYPNPERLSLRSLLHRRADGSGTASLYPLSGPAYEAGTLFGEANG